MNSPLSLRSRFFLAGLSACLVWFAFPNFWDKTLHPPLAWLAWIALIPFFGSLRGASPKQGALLGFTFGFVQFGGILYWIALLEAAENLSGLAWAALVVYLSLYFLAFGWIYCFLTARWKSTGVWMAPFLWVALEYFRGSRPWGGFSWGEIGYSQASYPAVLVSSTLAGVYGLTFLIVWFNASLARALERAGGDPSLRRPRWFYGVPPFVVLFFVILAGTLEIRSAAPRKAGTVALLQPSIDQSVKWSKSNEAATYDRIEGLVEGIAEPKPSLVVWPETGAPSYLLMSPKALERVRKIVVESKVPQLVGCLDARRLDDHLIHYYNAAIPFSAEGLPQGMYAKRHRVPFGEFVPFQKYLSFLGPVVGDLGNFDAGAEYQKFDARGFTYSPMICYEVIFPGDVQRAFKTGADALVNISNDAWYGRTASAYQHALMAVVRSAEEQKPLLRSANTGISLVTDPFGKITASTGLYDKTVLRGDVELLGRGPTLYARWGNWLPLFCWAVLLGLLTASFKKREQADGLSS